MNVKTCVAALIALTPLMGFAETSRYNYVEANYLQGDIDTGPEDVDFDGFALRGSYQFYEDFFVTGDYRDMEMDEDLDSVDVNGEKAYLGLGFIFGENDKGSFFGQVRYIDVNLDVSANGLEGEDDDSGYGLEAGFKMYPSYRSEITIAARYEDVMEDSETFGYAEFVFDFIEDLGGVASVEYGSDMTTVGLGVRYSF